MHTSGAHPTLRRNRIFESKRSGVLICDEAHGLLLENDIFANCMGGVTVMTGASPVLRRNGTTICAVLVCLYACVHVHVPVAVSDHIIGSVL